MNWEAIFINLVAALPPSLLALAAWLSSNKTGGKVDKVEVSVNGQRTTLLNEIAALKAQAVDLKGQVIDLKGEIVELKTEIYRLGKLTP